MALSLAEVCAPASDGESASPTAQTRSQRCVRGCDNDPGLLIESKSTSAREDACMRAIVSLDLLNRSRFYRLPPKSLIELGGGGFFTGWTGSGSTRSCGCASEVAGFSGGAAATGFAAAGGGAFSTSPFSFAWVSAAGSGAAGAAGAVLLTEAAVGASLGTDGGAAAAAATTGAETGLAARTAGPGAEGCTPSAGGFAASDGGAPLLRNTSR
jgi:hypothetical protein